MTDDQITRVVLRQPVMRETAERVLASFGALALLLVGGGVVALLWWLGVGRPPALIAVGAAAAWLLLVGRVWRAWRHHARALAEVGELRDRVADQARRGNAEFARRHLDAGEPFGLFLRSFDLEAVTGHGSRVGRPAAASVLGDGPVETALAEAVGNHIRVYAVANADAGGYGYLRGFPKVTIPDRVWQPALAALIGAAAVIVVDATEMTDGLALELRMIAALGREEQTVVVTPTAADLARIATRNRELALTGADRLPPTRPPQPGDLDGFPRRLRSDHIDAAALGDLPAFRGLLPAKGRS